jgi:hypothetical protein
MPIKSLSALWSKIREIAQEDEGEPNVVAVVIVALLTLLCSVTIVGLLTLLN